jgi:hypothetical protein
MAHSPSARDANDNSFSENQSIYPADSESVGEIEEGFQGEEILFSANQGGEVVPLKTKVVYSAPPKTAENVFTERAGPRVWPWIIDNGKILAAANDPSMVLSFC